MLKVYGIHGRTTALVRIPAGRSYLECEFTHGRLGVGPNNRPATYATSHATEQAIIENSPYYGKSIVLVRSYGVEEPKKEAKAKSAVKETKIYEDITTKEQAIALLKSLGATARSLTSDESMMRFAEKIGIELPNLVL